MCLWHTGDPTEIANRYQGLFENQLLKKINKEVCHCEQSKSKKVNDKKQWINVNWISWWLLWFPVAKRKDFGIRLLVHPFCFDKDDDVEEEGDEDKDDRAEDPNGKCGQSRRVGGGGGKGRVEHVHQNLFLGASSCLLWILNLIIWNLTSRVVKRRPQRAG